MDTSPSLLGETLKGGSYFYGQSIEAPDHDFEPVPRFFPAGRTATRLSDIRKILETGIEAVAMFGKEIFEVWINEEEPPQGGTWDSWDVCIEAVKDCDVLLAISNGNAGWADTSGAVGQGPAGACLGLLGTRERVTLSGGKLDCKSAPGRGTEIHAFFPVRFGTTLNSPARVH